MAKKRIKKTDDQSNAENAYQILQKTVSEYPSIEPTLWAAACWSMLVHAYILSEVSYEEFCKEVDEVKEHYSERWERRDDEQVD